MNTLSNYYKKHEVWKKVADDCLICFRCYELLGKDAFCVQSSDYFYLPISHERLRASENQQIELFLEVAPTERSKHYPTLQEAIAAHELEFPIRR